MADVYAVFGTLLALGIAYPGMLTAWWLLLPRWVNRASERLERTPWRCLGLGAAVGLPLGILIAILLALPFGPVKFLGASLLFGSLAIASVGASGLAALMGRRIAGQAGQQLSGNTAFLRGAVALELAAAFPLIGWFLMIPVSTIVVFGAAAFGIVGWMPVRKIVPIVEPALGQAS